MRYEKIVVKANDKQKNTKEKNLYRFYYNEQKKKMLEHETNKEITYYEYDCIECYLGEPTYETLVDFLVKLNYSASEENALLRKKIANLDNSHEFDIYNAYVEECKTLAKELLGE